MIPSAFAALYPRLYHLTRPDMLPAIRRDGLLSAERLCAKYGGDAAELIARKRPDSVTLSHPVHGQATLNDNKPLHLGPLEQCLDDGLSASDWVRLLNARVFFWTDAKRFARLKGGPAHRGEARSVLVMDSRSLLEAHLDRATVSPINTGSSTRRAARRGLATFAPLADLDYAVWRRSRPKKSPDRIVELSIRDAVPDAMDHCVDILDL